MPFSVRYFSARAAQWLLRMFGGREYIGAILASQSHLGGEILHRILPLAPIDWIRDNEELTAMARGIEGAYSCGTMFVLDHIVRQAVR